MGRAKGREGGLRGLLLRLKGAQASFSCCFPPAGGHRAWVQASPHGPQAVVVRGVPGGSSGGLEALRRVEGGPGSARLTLGKRGSDRQAALGQ